MLTIEKGGAPAAVPASLIELFHRGEMLPHTAAESFRNMARATFEIFPEAERVMLVRVNGMLLLLWEKEDGSWFDRTWQPVLVEAQRDEA